jgi:hypothetical protein
MHLLSVTEDDAPDRLYDSQHKKQQNHSTVSPLDIRPDIDLDLASLQTEQSNSKTTNIDTVSSLELCRKCSIVNTFNSLLCLRIFTEIINNEDATVASAVQACLPQVASAIDTIVPRLLAGGRVVYSGAGTSGRLAGYSIPDTQVQRLSSRVGSVSLMLLKCEATLFVLQYFCH